jgi:hypothetical protein
MAVLQIEVVAGMCRLEFRSGSKTGKDPETNPGVGFSMTSDYIPPPIEGKLHLGSGVICRQDARKLRDMLDAFLRDHP